MWPLLTSVHLWQKEMFYFPSDADPVVTHNYLPNKRKMTIFVF